MAELKPRARDKWEALPTAELRSYLKKYQDKNAPGKVSSCRRKKIRFIQQVLQVRERTERLLNPPPTSGTVTGRIVNPHITGQRISARILDDLKP